MAAQVRSRAAGVIAGLAAGAVVLGVGQLVAALIDPASAPFYVLGATVIDRTPQGVREGIIGRFGSKDKLVLYCCLGVGAAVLSAVVGLVERRRPAGSAMLAVLGIAVAVAALMRPAATGWFVAPTALGVMAGIGTLRILTAAAGQAEPATAGLSRRRFLGLSAAAVTVAVAATAGARYVGKTARDLAADRRRFAVPSATARQVPPGARLSVPGITSFQTSNDAFYRVDTALQIPAVTADDWQLRIHGLVDRELRLTFDDLRRHRAIARMITLTCVSNEVGGDLAGNAVWTGYPLADLLHDAGVRPDADMLLSRSSDGFTAGTPVEAVLDGRDAMLAVGMNGEPLPLEHGYPARLVVPGLYGYVSATKWVVDLELTRFDRANAYWTSRGWAAKGPIKIASRIDVPAAFATVAPGRVTVAGVAWAQHRGIRAVEVQVDDEPWRPAELAQEYSTDTWRQWKWSWDARPGTHTLRVRATDGTGTVQTSKRAAPFPDGASGWASRVITVG
ncbi:molybdopterin-dependent oxidoreductase [Skermania sp. ID1734]|uniref:molybdopterin-dependent oxidoreductase n=1 Tax=Skermania sp. ID1734 TaxID=2597516 RepID=UPI00117D4106|nr:molybdopterin-dependent oxidoreductase [Skermania sp. ID1734]TSD99179.1 molybdopterin-dependent oxidoreductase [Skermania sp. ID1734]